MQRVLLRKPDCPVHLMCNRWNFPGSLPGTDFCNCDIKAQRAGGRCFACGNRHRLCRSYSAGEYGECLLDRLELADGPTELNALVGILDRLLQH